MGGDSGVKLRELEVTEKLSNTLYKYRVRASRAGLTKGAEASSLGLTK
jgi:hypothetical protein